MANESIIKLADAVYFEYCHALPREGQYGYETCMNALRHIATEQDRIARQEERERCVKAMQKMHCENKCSFFNRLHTCPMCNKWNCNETEDIRKAMEGGKQ